MTRILVAMMALLVAASVPVAGEGISPPRTDCYGDPLLDGTVARLGTVHFLYPSGVCCVAFAPDCKTVASASADGTVRLWDPRSGRELKRFGSRRDRMQSVAFSPDGKRLAAGGSGGFYVWQVATGEEVLRNEGHSPQFLAFADGGKAIVHSVRFSTFTLGGDGEERESIELCQFAGGEPKELQNRSRDNFFSCTGDPQPPIPIAVTSSGRWVVGRYSSWDLTTGKEQPWNLDLGWDVMTRFAFTSSETILAGTTRGKVRLLEFASRRTICAIEGVAGLLAFSPDGRTLATPGPDHTVRLIDVPTGEERRRLTGHQGEVNAISFSPDGRLLATASADNTVLIWELHAERVRLRHSPETLRKLWTDLDDADPARAYRAVWALTDAPDQSPAFLRASVRSLFATDTPFLARCITDLDSDDFDVRDQARLELEQAGDLAEPALRRALAGTPSVEARHQILALLERLETANGFDAQRRLLRVVETLEMIGTPEARRELQRLAADAPGTWLKQETQAALQRLAQRSLSANP